MVTPQSTRVFPIEIKTEPVACGAMPSSKLTGRNCSGRRSFRRFISPKLDEVALSAIVKTQLIKSFACFSNRQRGDRYLIQNQLGTSRMKDFVKKETVRC